ncbi:Hermansky-Pudlak syndrome 5-like protein [Armadillidium nasatum]|uniref:Hermansky-Pudlak syndrome 5-like protein n=1 Tax=Armadillidium nasatum TaxID=96803 RepID=A0A5N5STC9_9CRUS|nr:Hermansky-Pudlak syndrome 5-like protein [Armadillidium nasatum]
MAVSDILVLLRNDIEKSIPGNSSFKIKVTAIDICDPYIVLGSNAGTLYLFNNETSSFIQKLQTTKGRITQISISPDIAFVACSSSSGLVFILKIPNFVPQSNLHPVTSRKHEGSIVTALSWSNNGRDLYIGDGDGILSLLHVPPNLASSLILNLTHYLMKMDSAIYQIDTHSHYLLVSTLTKSYICNTRLETFSVKSIQMLQDIDEEIPSLVPLKRLIIKDAFSLLSQGSNVMVMDDFSNNQDFPKLQFSKDVFSKIDEIVQQATAMSKEEACQMFYFREKKNSSKKYIDIGDDASKEITEGLSGPKNSNLQWESSLSTDQFQPNELIEKFDRNLSRKNYHWGVKARILNGVCYLCHLGLAIDVMVKAGGLIVFPCGHAYHNVCLAQYDKFCFICVRSRSK